jgi:SAM-dependent methyltransferase
MEHDHQDGDALVTAAKRYELTARIGFLGRRRQVYDDLVALSGARPGDRVLDVGCGTGFFSRRAVRAVRPGGQVIGVDPSQPVIDHATGRAPDDCTFALASAQDLPYGDDSFDVVLSSLAVHHVPEGERSTAMREMSRVLRPGGSLLLVELSGTPWHIRLAGRFGIGRAHAHRHSSPVDLDGLVAEAGLQVTGSGDRWPSLRYVRAVRPGARSAGERVGEERARGGE